VDGIGKSVAYAVFEAFVQHQVATDVLVPKFGDDAIKERTRGLKLVILLISILTIDELELA